MMHEKQKLIRRIIARIKCRLDSGEWYKHYCTNDCNTCGYAKGRLDNGETRTTLS